jgi:hypothetical protein
VCVVGGGEANLDIVPLFVHRNLWPFTEGDCSAVSGDAIWGCDSLCGRDQSLQNKSGVISL